MNVYFNGIMSFDFTLLVFIKFPLIAQDFAIMSKRAATSHMWPFKLKLKLKCPLATCDQWLLYWAADQ